MSYQYQPVTEVHHHHEAPSKGFFSTEVLKRPITITVKAIIVLVFVVIFMAFTIGFAKNMSWMVTWFDNNDCRMSDSYNCWTGMKNEKFCAGRCNNTAGCDYSSYCYSKNTTDNYNTTSCCNYAFNPTYCKKVPFGYIWYVCQKDNTNQLWGFEGYRVPLFINLYWACVAIGAILTVMTFGFALLVVYRDTKATSEYEQINNPLIR